MSSALVNSADQYIGVAFFYDVAHHKAFVVTNPTDESSRIARRSTREVHFITVVAESTLYM